MKAVSSLIALTLLAAPLAGCIVRSDRHHHQHSARRGGGPNKSCGPAYHWNGYKCVHNGNGRAKGHRK